MIMTEKKNISLSHLEPKIIWSIFEKITRVPRPSKKEEKIREWVKNWAKEHNVTVQKEDEVGNLLLRKEATPGWENCPTLVLQAHLDMVCQKTPEVDIDFENDPIPVIIDDGKVTAEGTTLGADNGIGMAYSLAALIDPDLEHGPLEVVLTVDEETGLTGAFNMEDGFFSGKYLLNVDSEEEGEITISSAGGGGSELRLEINPREFKDVKSFKLTISGLQGGHSGTEIHLPRLNAIKVGTEGLLTIKQKAPVYLHSINGGSAHNAIPRDFTTEFLIPEKKTEEVKEKITTWKEEILEKASQNEPGLEIKLEEIITKTACSEEKTNKILTLLSEIKHGPHSYSETIPDLVQTSSNLAEVHMKENNVVIIISTRSSVNSELDAVRKGIKKLGEKNDAEVIQGEAYPGWQPKPDAPFLQIVKKAYEDVLNQEVELRAIHAGLECGLFLSLEPELQVTSIGPDIRNAHSPDEYVVIKSVELLWQVIKEIIRNMKDLEK
jgi:dipeptidase D